LKYLLLGWKYEQKWEKFPTFVKDPKLSESSDIVSDVTMLQLLARSDLIMSPFIEADFFKMNLKLATLKSFLGFASYIGQAYYSHFESQVKEKVPRRPTLHVWEFVRCASVALATGSRWLMVSLVKDAYDRGRFHHETWKPQSFNSPVGWLRANAFRSPFISGVMREEGAFKPSDYYLVGKNGVEYVYTEASLPNGLDRKLCEMKNFKNGSVFYKVRGDLADLPAGEYFVISAQSLFWNGKVTAAPRLVC
jgi:hypothetical protein